MGQGNGRRDTDDREKQHMGVMSYVLFAWEVFQFTSHVSGATSIVSAEKGYNMMMIFASIDFKIHLLV